MEYQEWDDNIFKDYHNNDIIFVENVLNFFFNELDNYNDIDPKNYKYYFYRINEQNKYYYKLKSSTKESIENFQKFMEHYHTTLKKKRLYNLLKLQKYPDGEYVILKEEKVDKPPDNVKIDINTKEIPGIFSGIISEPIYDVVGPPIKYSDSKPTLNPVSNNIDSPVKALTININYIQNNILSKYNDIFGLNNKRPFENIISEISNKEKIWTDKEIDYIINLLKTVISYNQTNCKYKIFGTGSTFEITEDWLSYYVYKFEENGIPKTKYIIDLIKSNKDTFTDPKTLSNIKYIPKITKKETAVETLQKNLDEEIDFVEKFIEINESKFWYVQSGIRFGVNFDRILSMKKIYAEVNSNSNLKDRLERIIDAFDSPHMFTKNFKKFIQAHSKKYELRFDENRDCIVGSSKETLLFIK